MCTEEEVKIGTTTLENALFDTRAGEYIGNYELWIAEPGNEIEHLELRHLEE